MNFISLSPALAGLLLSLWFPPKVQAQQAPAATTQRSLLRQLYGDLAFEVRTRGTGSVTIGAADEKNSVVVTLLSTDLRRWSDSANRMLAARPPRRGQSVSWNAVVEGPGVVAGSMSLTRAIAPGDTTLVLLVTDTGFKAVRTRLTMTDAKALVGAMRRAALASLPPPTPAPARRGAPPPAPKKPPAFE